MKTFKNSHSHSKYNNTVKCHNSGNHQECNSKIRNFQQKELPYLFPAATCLWFPFSLASSSDPLEIVYPVHLEAVHWQHLDHVKSHPVRKKGKCHKINRKDIRSIGVSRIMETEVGNKTFPIRMQKKSITVYRYPNFRMLSQKDSKTWFFN